MHGRVAEGPYARPPITFEADVPGKCQCGKRALHVSAGGVFGCLHCCEVAETARIARENRDAKLIVARWMRMTRSGR